MKKFAIMFAVVCLGSSLAFAGSQTGSSSSTTSTAAAVENNSSKPEKESATKNNPTKKTKQHTQQDSKRTEASRPLTAEEQEWEKTVYNP